MSDKPQADAGRLSGILSALIVVSEVFGDLPLTNITDQEWRLYRTISSRLTDMAASIEKGNSQ